MNNLDSMTHFWTLKIIRTIFLRQDVFLTVYLFYTLWRIQTAWRNFWRYEDFLDVMTCFWCHVFFTYFWRHDALLDVMMCLWRHDELFDVITHCVTLLRLFNVMMDFCDVMTHLLTLWRVLLSWRTFWRYDNFVWRHDVFLTSWRVSFLTLGNLDFCAYLGPSYYLLFYNNISA